MRLATYVFVTDPEGAARPFGPDDDKLPDWAVAAITNPKAWAEPPASPAEPAPAAVATVPAPAPDDGLAKLTVPALKKYATEHGVDLGDATKKDAILAAIRVTTSDATQAQSDGQQESSGGDGTADGANTGDADPAAPTA